MGKSYLRVEGIGLPETVLMLLFDLKVLVVGNRATPHYCVNIGEEPCLRPAFSGTQASRSIVRQLPHDFLPSLVLPRNF